MRVSVTIFTRVDRLASTSTGLVARALGTRRRGRLFLQGHHRFGSYDAVVSGSVEPDAAPDAEQVQEPPDPAIAAAGRPVDEIHVQIGPQFLELFSEHLYSSPNKAFEELVSNSWDAGASNIYIGMSAHLDADNAAVWVLDDGVSMDFTGLEALWAVATSHKREAAQSNRPQIGKFGIGKLATYLLANCLTYVCKASDGVTRAVTMDYRRIDEKEEGRLHIDPLPLTVRELDEDQLAALLATFPEGDRIRSLLDAGIPPAPQDPQYENEFGGSDVDVEPQVGTWTLAVLTSLKAAGRSMQAGHIKRMLRYALPLGASIRMDFNGAVLESTKVNADLDEEWVLGENLEIPSITLDDEEDPQELAVQENSDDAGPRVLIDGIPGPITGKVRLYEDKISGGKSEAVGSSNGFFINVLGRVINADDPYFGLENLNHSAWAKFRATIRADGLDGHLAVNREGLLESPSLVAFRKFLFAIFNKARAAHDANFRANWPNVGQVLTETWGTVPLRALRQVITDSLAAGTDLPAFIRDSGVDREAELERMEASDPDNVADIISDVVIEDLSTDDAFVTYDLATRRIVVNRQHPFALEHGETHEQQLLLRDAALVDLLTQAFMADLGVRHLLRGRRGDRATRTRPPTLAWHLHGGDRCRARRQRRLRLRELPARTAALPPLDARHEHRPAWPHPEHTTTHRIRSNGPPTSNIVNHVNFFQNSDEF
jgi:hypothetical protein